MSAFWLGIYIFLYLAMAATLFGHLCRLAKEEGADGMVRLIFWASLLWPLSLIAGYAWSSTLAKTQRGNRNEKAPPGI